MTAPVRRLVVAADAPEVGTPRWWVDVLYRRLVDRAADIEFFDAYYRGDHPLPWLAPQAREEFRRVLKMARANYMGLVVDSKAERMQIEGFRVADGEGQIPDEGDDELWRIWQANDLDSDSDLAWVEALIAKRSYMLVAPNPDDARTPLVTIEDASQTIVAYEPGSRRKAIAALKVWLDEWTGGHLATLYLPGGLWKVRSNQVLPTVSGVFLPPTWVPRVGDDFSIDPNPLGEVPFAEISLTPRLRGEPRAFLTDVVDIQDRINKTLADRLMTQDFGAFPQKWAKGWPDEDASGNANPKIEVGRDRMVTTDAIDAAFGQWDAAPLDPYSAAKREDVKDIASRTRTPAQYLLGELNNVNGETLKASEAGHIAVVRQMCRYGGDGVERGMRLVQKAAGLPPSPGMETIWRNPEYRTVGEVMDASIKGVQAGLISKKQAREDVGYSATQSKRIAQEMVDEAAATGLGGIGALFAQGEADAAGA